MTALCSECLENHLIGMEEGEREGEEIDCGGESVILASWIEIQGNQNCPKGAEHLVASGGVEREVFSWEEMCGKDIEPKEERGRGRISSDICGHPGEREGGRRGIFRHVRKWANLQVDETHGIFRARAAMLLWARVSWEVPMSVIG